MPQALHSKELARFRFEVIGSRRAKDLVLMATHGYL
jgi:hypothetical protein